MMKRSTLLAFTLITTAGAGNTPPPPGAQYGQPPLGMPLPPFPGGPRRPGRFATAMNCFAPQWPAIIRRKVCRN